MANAIKIRLENPPDSKRGRHATAGAIQTYIKTLREEHPGQWAVLDRKKKNIAYLYALKKQHKDLEVTTRKNTDGTHGVWLKVSSEAKAKAVKATEAKRRAKLKAAKATKVSA
jgi:hypothetical protein